MTLRMLSESRNLSILVDFIYVTFENRQTQSLG